MKKVTLFVFLFLNVMLVQAQSTCLTAVAIEPGIYTVDAVDGTQIPNPICAANGSGATHGKWFSYTPAQQFSVTVSTEYEINTGKDTRVHIYTGTCDNLVCWSGDDDNGVIGNGYLSIAQFDVIAGTTYYIAFDDKWNASGFEFHLIESPYVAPVISFIPTTIPTSSSICAVVDMNGDYLDDIVSTQSNQMTILYQNLGNSQFTQSVYPLPNLTANPSWSIAAGDYDKNGYNDLVFGSGNRLAIIKANPTGTGYSEITYPQNIFTQRTNFIDIDNDGNLDLFACHDVAQSHVYRNTGSGDLVFDISMFPTLAVGGNYASIWTDYNNDGHMDMYLAKCRGGAVAGDPQRINLLYKNNGDGTYTETGAQAGVNDGAQSWSTAIEDFDNDGDMDFMLSNISDQNRFYLNNGDGTFTDIYSTTGIDAQVGSWEIQSGDFNNDGLVDFLWQNNKELYLNNGDLTFTGYDLPFSEGGIGDLNNDGFLDVQFNNQVYLNVPNANNWIKVNLAGTTSNINGIGARVELYYANGKQIREIRSGNGFSHQSSLNASFGIGAETSITKIVVKWPSGVVDEILNPVINSSLKVTEGTSLGLNQNNDNVNFTVYPNPSGDKINFEFDRKNATITEALVTEMNGKIAIKTALTNNAVDIHSLAKGNYILILKDANDKTYTHKIIKK